MTARVLRLATTSAVAGLCLNLALCFACWRWAPKPPRIRVAEQWTDIRVTQGHLAAWARASDGWPPPFERATRFDSIGLRVVHLMRLIEAADASSEIERNRGRLTLSLWIVKIGWPLGAFETYITRRTRGRNLDPFERSALHVGTVWLPERILWTGLIINSLFYAMILTTLWWLWSLARQTVRRYIGKCPRCGYNLDTSVCGCAECGWGRHGAAA